VTKRAGSITALVAVLVALLVAVPAASVPGATPPSTASAACATAPTFKSSGTRFGVSLSYTGGGSLGTDLTTEEKRFGGRIPVVRTWDTGMPKAGAWKERASWLGTRWVVTSIRLAPQDVNAGKYDAQLRDYFDSAPTTAPIFWSYYHEPEDEVKRGDFTASQFRTAFKRIAGIAAESCKPNLYPTLILMGWTADPASKLDWTDYYPGSSSVSVLGWDPYNGANGDATSYRSPDAVFGNVADASRAAGKPWGIAETGTVRVPGDSSGTGRAAWLKSSASYLRNQGASWVTYFQSTNKGDFELRDAAGVAAWSAAITSSP
jgi:hypothetical protein